jgi:hypothetical protein
LPNAFLQRALTSQPVTTKHLAERQQGPQTFLAAIFDQLLTDFSSGDRIAQQLM